MNNRVVIEQAAVLSAFGTLSETTDSLLEGRTAVRPGPCFGVEASYAPFSEESFRDPATCIRVLRSSLDISEYDPSRTLFLYCAAKGDLRSLEEYVATGTSPHGYPGPVPGEQAKIFRKHFGLSDGPTRAVSNACASGTIGVETAVELLRAGQIDTAVLFGFESLCRFVATGFHSLGAVSASRARPFDRDRDGLTLGEGAAAAVLRIGKTRPGDTFIAGMGSSNDANHRTGPSRTGDGLHAAALAAIRDSSCEISSIGGVKCHGTGTLYNDAMEAKAIMRLFGHKMPACLSLKGALGHTSGGGSLLEILLAAQFLKQKKLPPTIGYLNAGVEEPLPVSSSCQTVPGQYLLCLSAGFGGVNAAAVVGVSP